MAYTVVPYANFGGGLNLTAQSEVARDQNQALDLLNVTFSRLGSIRQRDGFAKFSTSAGANRYDSLAPFYKTDGTKQLLAGAGTRLDTLNTAGGVVGSAVGLSGGPWNFTRFGAPNQEVVYAAGNGGDTIRKWDGTTWTAPNATVQSVAGLNMPKGSFLAVTGVDNRLVVSGFTSTTGGPNNLTTSPSHVYFSQEGKPEEYLNNSFLQLRPGDGEKIMGIIAWGDYVFMFKETAFWVYYGTSVDTAGNPIFNVRPIQVGIGAVSSKAIVAGEDGVYFLSNRGVYRTTGQAPELVTAQLDPFFNGDPAPYFRSNPINPAALTTAAMGWHRGQLYLSVPTGQSTTNDRLFVFDPRYKWWTLYDFKASALASMKIGPSEELVFAYASGTNDIARHSPLYSNDAGTTINARWSSGWLDFGSSDQKTIVDLKLWATGRFRIGLATDYGQVNNLTAVDLFATLDLWGDGTNLADLWGDGTTADMWGDGTSAASALVRHAELGTVFSITLSNFDASPWELTELSLHMREIRPPSVIRAD